MKIIIEHQYKEFECGIQYQDPVSWKPLGDSMIYPGTIPWENEMLFIFCLKLVSS